MNLPIPLTAEEKQLVHEHICYEDDDEEDKITQKHRDAMRKECDICNCLCNEHGIPIYFELTNDYDGTLESVRRLE